MMQTVGTGQYCFEEVVYVGDVQEGAVFLPLHIQDLGIIVYRK